MENITLKELKPRPNAYLVEPERITEIYFPTLKYAGSVDANEVIHFGEVDKGTLKRIVTNTGNYPFVVYDNHKYHLMPYNRISVVDSDDVVTLLIAHHGKTLKWESSDEELINEVKDAEKSHILHMCDHLNIRKRYEVLIKEND